MLLYGDLLGSWRLQYQNTGRRKRRAFDKPRETRIEYTETRRVVSTGGPSDPAKTHGEDVTITQVPRIRLGPEDATFDEVLLDAKPVILEGLNLGACVEKWTPQYMVEKVGDDTEVSGCFGRGRSLGEAD